MQICQWCGHRIGPHETAHARNNQIVCSDCVATASEPRRNVSAASATAPAYMPKAMVFIALLLLGAMVAVVLPLYRKTARLELEVDTLRSAAGESGELASGFSAGETQPTAVGIDSSNAKPADMTAIGLSRRLDSLTETVNHNADVASKTTADLSHGLDSLKDTVDRNAEAENEANATLTRGLSSLVDTVNYNADLINQNDPLNP
jgi:hypothetical protein